MVDRGNADMKPSMEPTDELHGPFGPLPDREAPKAVWRQWGKTRRAQAQKTLTHESLVEAVLGWEAIHHAAHIMMYWPMVGEWDLRSLMVRLPKATFYLPRMAEASPDLTFHRYDGDPHGLESHRWGVAQPPVSAPLWNPDNGADTVMIVPALLVDDRGIRLGYGKGYYDRWLGALNPDERPPTTVSVVADAQRVPRLPADSWDRPVDGIITEGRIFRFPPNPDP